MAKTVRTKVVKRNGRAEKRKVLREDTASRRLGRDFGIYWNYRGGGSFPVFD